jgi:type IV secretion system protein TrbJ
MPCRTSTSITAVVIVLAFTAGAGRARAQGIPVYDNTSFLELVQQFEQGAQQLAQLQQQLTAQLDMLRSLPSTIMPGLGDLVQQTQSLMQQVSMIQDMGTSLQSQLDSLYPTNYSTMSMSGILSQLSQMTTATQGAYQTSMSLQNQVAANQPQLAEAVQAANSASMGAAGPTAAIQASNQILGALSQQLGDMQSLLVGQQRATDQQQLQDASEAAAGQETFVQTWQPSTTQAPAVQDPW